MSNFPEGTEYWEAKEQANDQTGMSTSSESQKPSAVEETVGVPVSEQSSSTIQPGEFSVLATMDGHQDKLAAFLEAAQEAYLASRSVSPTPTILTVSLTILSEIV